MKRSSQSKHKPSGPRAGRFPLLLTIVAGAAAFSTLAAFVVLYSRYSMTSVNIPTVAVLATETATPLPIATASPSASPTEVIPTEASTSAPTVTPTSTPTSIPTVAASATPTETLAPTATPTGSGLAPAITATTGPISTERPESTATETPVEIDPVAEGTEEAYPTAAAAKPCISLVGDSVTHGGVTYEIPATGYIVGLTNPLSIYVERALREHGITDLQVYDRGASHTGISSENHPSYFRTVAYRALRRDHCKYTMIMPWLNDISPGIPAEVAAPRHVRALIELVQELAEVNPEGKIVVLDYFHGAVAPFAAQSWASGFTLENVDIYNREIGLSCNLGTLSLMSQVSCVNIDDAFVGLEHDSYVISWISRQELTRSLIAQLNPIQQAWLDNYYAASPDGLLQGDGVHLSTAGKLMLAEFLIRML